MRASWILALGLSLVGSAAHAGDPAPPLVVFHAVGTAADGARARAALEAAAERLGSSLVDLSPPPEPVAEAPLHLRRAIEAYHDFRYADALASADLALAEAGTTGAAGLSPADLSDLLIHRALALGEQGDSARAWDDFVRAATIDPGRVLDPVRFSPRVVETFARAVVAVTAAPPSQLAAEVPEGCAVWLDGREITGQASLTTLRGEHYLRVRCPQRAPYGAVILVSGERHAAAPTLRAIAVPTDDEVRALARERGFARVVWTRVAPVGRGAPIATLRLYDAASPALRGSAAVGIGGPRAPAALAAALERLARPAADVVSAGGPRDAAPAPVRWYRKPWLWGIVGAAVASAILLPFVLDGPGTPTGFDVRPGGALPP